MWEYGGENKIEFKENHKCFPNVRFGKIPGLYDMDMSQNVAEAITKALHDAAKSKRSTKIFLITSVKSGKIDSNDILTFKKILRSITLPSGQKPSQNHYAVIINRCDFLQDPSFEKSIKRKWESTFTTTNLLPYTTNHIFFAELVSSLVGYEDNAVHIFPGLKEWVDKFHGIRV